METIEQLRAIAESVWDAAHGPLYGPEKRSFIDGYVYGFRAAQTASIARSIPRVIDEHHHDDNESD